MWQVPEPVRSRGDAVRGDEAESAVKLPSPSQPGYQPELASKVHRDLLESLEATLEFSPGQLGGVADATDLGPFASFEHPHCAVLLLPKCAVLEQIEGLPEVTGGLRRLCPLDFGRTGARGYVNRSLEENWSLVEPGDETVEDES